MYLYQRQKELFKFWLYTLTERMIVKLKFHLAIEWQRCYFEDTNIRGKLRNDSF